MVRSTGEGWACLSLETLDVAPCLQVSLPLVSLSPSIQTAVTAAVHVHVLGFLLIFPFYAVMWLSLLGYFPVRLSINGKGL
jgi:hypothetical protein